jgi:hypothetical protein
MRSQKKSSGAFSDRKPLSLLALSSLRPSGFNTPAERLGLQPVVV